MISWVYALSSVMPWVSTQYLCTCETVHFTCCYRSLRETFLNIVDSILGLVDRWWSPWVPGKKAFQIISFTSLCSKTPLAFVPSCLWPPRNTWLPSSLLCSHSVLSSSSLFLWSHKPLPKPPHSQAELLLLILWTFGLHWHPGSCDLETEGVGEASPFILFIKIFL